MSSGLKVNINAQWAPRKVFANYQSLITARGNIIQGADLDEWIYEAEYFRNDIDFLLNCKHHEFWSYMVYQKAALAAVVSFLQHATPFYINIGEQTTDTRVLELYEEILSLVVRVVCRLVTQKESPDAWINKEDMRELLYRNYLVSIPMLFDLLIAVGDADANNVSVLRNVFQTLMEIEPNYLFDLQAALLYFKAAYRSIQTQAENEGFEGAGGGAVDDGETPYDDVALYALNCAFSLSMLLEVYPEVRKLCDEIKLGPSIAHFYDTTIPFLYKNICLINEMASSLFWLNQARLQLLRAFRRIAYSYIEEFMEKPGEALNLVEQYIALLTECLSEQTFVVDYQREYPVEFDIEILRQSCSELDYFKANFVLNGYQKEAESSLMGTIENATLTLHRAHEAQLTKQQLNQQATVVHTMSSETHVRTLPLRDIDAEMNAVLDMLPNMGTGFVRRLLSRYDRSEDAIAAILENNLPPDLVTADQSEVYIPLDPQDQFYNETGVQHFNIHDGDKYDVLTNAQPNCIIKRGKGFPNTPKNAAQLLDDKTDLNFVRHRYQEYTLVAEGSDHDEYDDEYDDSYEALLESETRVPRSKELKVGLANVADVSEGESSNEDEIQINNTHTSEDPRRDKMNFCENPEIVRERYEAKRQAKWGNRNNKSRNVVGVPKGQGQDNEILRNRQRKEANKSSHANHNRKSGAAFKRSKGMIA